MFFVTFIRQLVRCPYWKTDGFSRALDNERLRMVKGDPIARIYSDASSRNHKQRPSLISSTSHISQQMCPGTDWQLRLPVSCFPLLSYTNDWLTLNLHFPPYMLQSQSITVSVRCLVYNEEVRV